jgi:glycosyltransferase involved in cell wall biosynthesis
MPHITIGAYLLSGTPGYRQAGVHHYAKHLLLGMAQTQATWRDTTNITALISPTAQQEISNLQSPISFLPASRTTEDPWQRIWVEQIETPQLLSKIKADLYHGLLNVLPLRAPCPCVVSVMDLSFLTQPQTHRWFNRTYLSLFARLSCRKAARVITISQNTKRDVANYFGVDLNRIDAIPLGVTNTFKRLPDEDIAQFKRDHNIGDQAAFYLGSIEPRKNLTRLIEAFAQLTHHSTTQPLNHSTPQLFIGGSLGWKYDETLARIQSLGLAKQVQLMGRVAEDDLPKWYSACNAFVYPSLYEGFGLPVLEAMACGAPVITSNVTSLPEVVGDAGVIVEPTDTEALAAAMVRVLSHPALQAELRAKAMQRAAQFTWRRTAEQTVETYRRVLGL